MAYATRILTQARKAGQEVSRTHLRQSGKFFDVIVVGAGAVGSAALYHLAKQGVSVLGVDRFLPPHQLGSSGGGPRITRIPGEGVEYASLALRSQQLWRELEAQTGEKLFDQCGCLVIGKRDTAVHGAADFLANMRLATQRYQVPIEEFMSGAAIRQRFPQFNARQNEHGFFDPWGGYVRAEASIAVHLKLAQSHGAALLGDTVVTDYKSSQNGVSITTASGDTYYADQMLLSAGAWLPDFLPSETRKNLRVSRQVVCWFDIHGDARRFFPKNFPTFIWDVKEKDAKAGQPKANIYGFPIVKGEPRGMKVTHEDVHETTSADAVNRTATQKEINGIYNTYVKPYFDGVGPECLQWKVCLYTNAPGGRFLIDTVPGQPRVRFVSACSGHGFKFSSAIGEGLADTLVLGEPQRVDLRPFTRAQMKRHAKQLTRA